MINEVNNQDTNIPFAPTLSDPGAPDATDSGDAGESGNAVLPRAWGYWRAWSGDPDGAQQRQAIARHFRETLRPKGFLWAGMFADEASERGKPFRRRLAGGDLYPRPGRGDVVIIAAAFQSFTSLRDMARTALGWHGWGVVTHLLDMGPLDSGTDLGRAALYLLQAFWRQEDEARGELVKAAHDALRAQGKPAGRTPYGFKVVRGRLVADEESRQVGRKIVLMRVSERLSWQAIRKRLEAEGIERRNGRPWSGWAMVHAYQQELKLLTKEMRKTGGEDSPDVPPG